MKKNRISDLKERITKYKADLEKLEEFNAILAPYTGKIIDKRFYTANNLIEKRDYNTWTKYEVHKSSYDWGKPYSISIGYQCKIELDSRETTHIKEAVKGQIDNMKNWISNSEAELMKTVITDEKAIKRAILAIFKKYKPTENVWRDILEEYEVKYPNN